MPSRLTIESKQLLEIARLINPQFSSVTEQPIEDSQGKVIGWNSHVIDTSDRTISGGTASDRNVARRIGIAEFFERSFVAKFRTDERQSANFHLDRIPTTSGFAAGFERDATSFRSLCEGFERWAWSHWIDKKCKMPRLENAPRLTELASHMQSSFDEGWYFEKEFQLDPNLHPTPLKFCVFLGLTESGIFPGSRVTSANDDPWTHSVIEAWRNLRNFRQSLGTARQSEKLPTWLERRNAFFGANKFEGIRQIEAAYRLSWENAETCLHIASEPVNGIFLCRTLFKDFLPWHVGSDNRFVY